MPGSDFKLSAEAPTIDVHLSRICCSRAFRLSPRLIGFLEFTVRRTIEGRTADLKEYTIGIEVYGRGKDYDPKIDSIVRSEAVRLRRRLEAYYANEGAADKIRISYPKGSYIPRFVPQADTEAGRTEPRGCNTIAVLPFASLGTGADNQFLADGLTEELIVAFGRVPALRVVARSSCFQFHGKAVDAREAGRLVNAAWVLDGSIRSLDRRVRVTAQLMEVATGLNVWSEVFDRQIDDLLNIQNELASAIVRALKLPGAHASTFSSDPETHLLIIQARHFSRRYSVADAERSCALYERALSKTPQCAGAWAGLAKSLNFLSHRGVDSLSNATRARNAAEQALEIDPDSAEAHAINALLLGFNDRNWTAAERSLRRAVQLAPSDAGTLQVAAVCLMPIGKFEDSLALLRRAAEFDPLACTVQMDIGILFRLRGLSEQAIGHCQAALDLDPNHREAEWQLGLALQQAQRFAEALACFGRAAGRTMDDLATLGTIGNCYAEYGRRNVAVEMLRKLEQAAAEDVATILHGQALIHAALSQPEEALECLERCAHLRSSRLVLLPYDWRFARLSEHRRFQALLADLGFPSC